MHCMMRTVLAVVCLLGLVGCSREASLQITHDPAEFISYPDHPDSLVVRAGNNFTLICEGETRVNWTYPEYVFDDPDDSLKDISVLHNDQASKWSAQLSVMRATYKDNGYYYCKNEDGSRTASRYVYVRDVKHLFTDVAFSHFVEQNQSLLIPCRPTSPDVILTLLYDDKILVPGSDEGNNGLEVSYVPTVGFTISNIDFINDGLYECRGNRSEDGKTDSEYASVTVVARTSLLEEGEEN